MICVRCKNEKWDQDTCPKCGLGEKEAYLAQAEMMRSEGKIPSAIIFYDKYLFLDSENLDVLGRKGICLSIEALSSQDENIFFKAEKALNAVLLKNWDWEQGHQARINMFFGFEKIDLLLREYEKITSENDSRNPLSEKLIEVIKLAKKFKETPPPRFSEDSQSGKSLFLKSFWPSILGTPFLLWVAYVISSLPHALEGENTVILFFVISFAALSIIMLLYICMRTYKKMNPNQKK